MAKEANMGDHGYSLQEVFEMKIAEVQRSLTRIEGKVDNTQERVSKIEVAQAQSSSKLAIVVSLLFIAAAAIGTIVGSLILQGAAN